MSNRLRLPSEDSPREKRYVLPDPDALADRFLSARAAHIGLLGSRKLTDEEVSALLLLAQGYLDLTMGSMGQTACIAKLRDVWRARRRRAAGQ